MNRLIILIILTLPGMAVCQEEQKAFTKVSLQTVGSIGIIGGETGVKPVFQIISGLTQSRYFAGLGAGYDNYRFRSIPLFADIRFGFGKKQFVFAYGDLGYNLPLEPKFGNNDFQTTSIYSGGVYLDLGLGYRHRLNKKNSILFSFGYSRKDVNHKEGTTYPCFNPPCYEEMSYYHYKLGRIVTKLSWQFNKR